MHKQDRREVDCKDLMILNDFDVLYKACAVHTIHLWYPLLISRCHPFLFLSLLVAISGQKKLQGPLFCTLQQRQGALLDGCQVEETSSDQGSLASAFAQDSSSKDHTHVTGRLNWWSSLLSAFVGIPKHAVSQCAVNVLVHTLFLRQFDMSKRLQDCPSVNPPHLKKVGIFEFFNGLFKRRILWNLASGNWNESDGKAEATPYHFPGPSILVCQCYHNELEVPSKCQKNWHVHCLVACFVKEGTNPMHERRSKQIMRREMIPNLWTPPTSFLLVEGFDPKQLCKS